MRRSIVDCERTRFEKHKALDAIVVAESHNTSRPRLLQIRGRTEDHRVHAALQDFHRYCKAQVEENNTTLSELGGYYLGMLELDWNVEPVGFDPVDIRFEFDRDQMFELISAKFTRETSTSFCENCFRTPSMLHC